MTIIDNNTELTISIDYNPSFKSMVADVKKIPSAEWCAKEKVWKINNAYRNDVIALKECWGADMLTSVEYKESDIQVMPELEMELPINAVLRPYQRQGVAKGLEFERFLNSDEQGLGKTIQSISTIVAATKQGNTVFPCLVICPSAAKINWQREWEKFTNYKAIILDDRIRDTWYTYYEIGLAQIFIVNYDSLKKFFVQKMPPKNGTGNSSEIELKKQASYLNSIIVDELHYCKNPNTLRSKLCLRLAQKKKFRIGLTGTPILSRPSDLWPQLAILGRLNDFGGKRYFLNRFCEGGSGSNNLKELNILLKNTCYFRREKSEVAKDLPLKQRQAIICEITTRNEYDSAKKDLAKHLKDLGCGDAEIRKKLRGKALVLMNTLREISARGKLNTVIERISGVLETGNKYIVFCNLKSIASGLHKAFPNSVLITGSQNTAQKQNSIDSFQNDIKRNVCIVNIISGGAALNLTSACYVGFVEFPWTPAACAQCEDRSHRIGQVKNVMVDYFLGENTIDERIYEMILEKSEVANAITGSTDEMELSMVENLMQDILN